MVYVRYRNKQDIEWASLVCGLRHTLLLGRSMCISILGQKQEQSRLSI